jgi:hypothetical protein
MTIACSWCSAEIEDGATVCASCGANLVPEGDPNVPGVTAVDPASIMRSRPTVQPRGGLLAWLSGDTGAGVSSNVESQAIAPPDLEVRREILRLELEADVARLQAETDALLAEAAAEGRTLEGLAGAPTETEIEAPAAPGEDPTDRSEPEDPPPS